MSLQNAMSVRVNRLGEASRRSTKVGSSKNMLTGSASMDVLELTKREEKRQ